MRLKNDGSRRQRPFAIGHRGAARFAIEGPPPLRRFVIRRRILIAGLVSLGLHVFVVVPFGIARLLISTEQPMEIAYLPDPADAADSEGAPVTDKQQELAQLTKPPELKKKPEDKPDEPARRKPEEKQPEEKVKPPLAVIPDAHLKMVDQDQFQEEQDNLDAHFLAQKNHRAAKDVSAEDTNLVRNQQGQQVSEQSERQDQRVGAADRKIAELEKQQGPADRLPVQGQTGQEGQVRERSQGSPLALRDVVPLSSQVQPERRDGVEVQEPNAGALPMARSGTESQADRAAQQGAKTRLRLTHEDYDRVVGFDVAEAERRAAARAEQSHQSGRWERVEQKMAMMRSSLENFTGAVRTGNQSELGTRAHPFAAYIATMHRQIHKFWGFGFLEGIAVRPGSPYNDFTLWTGLEITLKEDGTVERLVIRHPSGQAAFDAAAEDAVMSAGPFPAPPEVIKSRDGKVYLDWPFHRDDRQCATDFVVPHILTDPPKGGPVRGLPQSRQRVAQGGQEAAPTARSLLGPLQGLGRGRSGTSSLVSAGSTPPAASGGQADPPKATEKSQPGSGEVPVGAKEVANKWLGAYLRGDARWLAGYSAVPFTAGGKTLAEEGDSLRTMYRQLLAENASHTGSLTFYTQAQIRKKMGRVPAGGDEDGVMFAVLQGGADDMVLLLQEADRGWRVVGIVR